MPCIVQLEKQTESLMVFAMSPFHNRSEIDRSPARPAKGATIPEFAVCLVAVLIAFAPICNGVSFGAAVVTIHCATTDVVKVVAMSESRKEALSSTETIYERLNNPIWTAMHRVYTARSADSCIEKADRKPSCLEEAAVGVHIISASNNVLCYPVSAPLPVQYRPGTKNNQLNLQYIYSLDVPCRIEPCLQMSALPFIGQVPILGAPVNLTFHAEAPVEFLGALDH